MNQVIEDGNGLVRNLICCPNCLPKEGESLMIEVERDSGYNPEEFDDSGFDPKECIGTLMDAYKEAVNHVVPKEIVDGLSKPKFEDKQENNMLKYIREIREINEYWRQKLAEVQNDARGPGFFDGDTSLMERETEGK